VLDCAERYYVKGSVGREIFATEVLYIDFRQCKAADYFTEEGGFFLAGLDQGQGDFGRPEFDGDSGEAGTRAKVGYTECRASLRRTDEGGCPHLSITREEVASQKEALAEVAVYDCFFAADGGEVDAGVPTLEYIDVRRYIVVERVVGRWALVAGVLQEGFEQFGDAGGVHGCQIMAVRL